MPKQYHVTQINSAHWYKSFFISSVLFGQKTLVNAAPDYNKNLVYNGDADLGIAGWSFRSGPGSTQLVILDFRGRSTTSVPGLTNPVPGSSRGIDGNYFELFDTGDALKTWGEMYQEINLSEYPNHNFIFSAYGHPSTEERFTVETYFDSTLTSTITETLAKNQNDCFVQAEYKEWVRVQFLIQPPSNSNRMIIRMYMPKMCGVTTTYISGSYYQARAGADRFSVIALKPAIAITSPNLTNYIPRQVLPIENKIIEHSDTASQFSISPFTFFDMDNATLLYSVTLADSSSLPNWLSFNPANLQFTISPNNYSLGNYPLRITASDGSNSAPANFILSMIESQPSTTTSTTGMIVPSTTTTGIPSFKNVSHPSPSESISSNSITTGLSHLSSPSSPASTDSNHSSHFSPSNTPSSSQSNTSDSPSSSEVTVNKKPLPKSPPTSASSEEIQGLLTAIIVILSVIGISMFSTAMLVYLRTRRKNKTPQDVEMGNRGAIPVSLEASLRSSDSSKSLPGWPTDTSGSSRTLSRESSTTSVAAVLQITHTPYDAQSHSSQTTASGDTHNRPSTSSSNRTSRYSHQSGSTVSSNSSTLTHEWGAVNKQLTETFRLPNKKGSS